MLYIVPTVGILCGDCLTLYSGRSGVLHCAGYHRLPFLAIYMHTGSQSVHTLHCVWCIPSTPFPLLPLSLQEENAQLMQTSAAVKADLSTKLAQSQEVCVYVPKA